MDEFSRPHSESRASSDESVLSESGPSQLSASDQIGSTTISTLVRLLAKNLHESANSPCSDSGVPFDHKEFVERAMVFDVELSGLPSGVRSEICKLGLEGVLVRPYSERCGAVFLMSQILESNPLEVADATQLRPRVQEFLRRIWQREGSWAVLAPRLASLWELASDREDAAWREEVRRAAISSIRAQYMPERWLVPEGPQWLRDSLLSDREIQGAVVRAARERLIGMKRGERTISRAAPRVAAMFIAHFHFPSIAQPEDFSALLTEIHAAAVERPVFFPLAARSLAQVTLRLSDEEGELGLEMGKLLRRIRRDAFRCLATEIKGALPSAKEVSWDGYNSLLQLVARDGASAEEQIVSAAKGLVRTIFPGDREALTLPDLMRRIDVAQRVLELFPYEVALKVRADPTLVKRVRAILGETLTTFDALSEVSWDQPVLKEWSTFRREIAVLLAARGATLFPLSHTTMSGHDAVRYYTAEYEVEPLRFPAVQGALERGAVALATHTQVDALLERGPSLEGLWNSLKCSYAWAKTTPGAEGCSRVLAADLRDVAYYGRALEPHYDRWCRREEWALRQVARRATDLGAKLPLLERNVVRLLWRSEKLSQHLVTQIRLLASAAAESGDMVRGEAAERVAELFAGYLHDVTGRGTDLRAPWREASIEEIIRVDGVDSFAVNRTRLLEALYFDTATPVRVYSRDAQGREKYKQYALGAIFSRRAWGFLDWS